MLLEYYFFTFFEFLIFSIYPPKIIKFKIDQKKAPPQTNFKTPPPTAQYYAPSSIKPHKTISTSPKLISY